MTRGVDDLLADLAEAADAAAELVRLGKERWDTERPLRLAGEAVIGRLGDIATPTFTTPLASSAWSAMKRTKVACAIFDQMILTGSRRTPQP